MGRYMTFQALKEANLLENIDGYYELTSLGEDYIHYYENNVNTPLSFFEYIEDDSINIDAIDSIETNTDTDDEIDVYIVEVLPMNGESFELYFDDKDIAEVTKLTINKSNNAVAY
jgi:hypothetical protein